MRTSLSGLLFWSEFLVAVVTATFIFNSRGEALTTFPYSIRTRDYSGWTPATQSDINTTGMAGATVALPLGISSAETNPAGYAMSMGSVSALINQVTITDLRIQPDGQPIPSTQWGAAVTPLPWGFSVTYYSPVTETGTYASAITGDTLQTEVSIRELRFTAARIFLDGHLALGLSAEVVTAIRKLGGYDYSSTEPSYRLGILYRLPYHLMFGAGYAPELGISPNSDDIQQNEMPGFNRTVWRPTEAEMGLGWEPNRFFKVGFEMSYAGPTPNTALLADQSMITGATPSWIPRLGASYVLADYKNFRSEMALGSYYEASRIQGLSARLHATAGLEAHPYFVNLGIGFDLASDYHNLMLGIGVDVIRILTIFDIVPRDPTPPYNGFFPRADVISADGLPEPMTKGEERKAPPQSLGDVGKIIKEAPGNIVDKVTGKPTTIEVKEDKQKQKQKPAKKRRKKKSARSPEEKSSTQNEKKSSTQNEKKSSTQTPP